MKLKAKIRTVVGIVGLAILVGVGTYFISTTLVQMRDKKVVKVIILDDRGKEGRTWIVEWDTISKNHSGIIFEDEDGNRVCLDKYIVKDIEK